MAGQAPPALSGKQVVLNFVSGQNIGLALDKECPVAQALLAQPVELVGVRGVPAADNKGRVKRPGQGAGEGVLVDLRRVAEGVGPVVAAHAQRDVGVPPRISPRKRSVGGK